MGTRTITERVHAPFAGSKVDREKGVISGVLICGAESANGRDYPRGAFGDGKQYEGRPVYADHGRERRVADKVGWFENIRFRSNGLPEGDFHVLKSHPLAGQLMEAAERNPKLFGFSHVARCKTSAGPNGRERVEAVEEVESVDIVAEPATTSGFYESTRMKITIKTLAEKLVRNPKSTVAQITRVKRLAEDGDYGDVDVADAPDGDADPDDGITAAFKAAIMSVVESALDGDTDPKEALAKIKTLLNSHGDATDAGTGEGEGDGEGGDNSEEGKKGKGGAGAGNSLAEALTVAESIGFRASGKELRTIAAAAPADRKEIAQTLKEAVEAKAGPAKPRSAGRHGAQKVEESAGGAKPAAGKLGDKWVI